MNKRKILAWVCLIALIVLIGTGALFLRFSDGDPASSVSQLSVSSSGEAPAVSSVSEEAFSAYSLNHYHPPVDMINDDSMAAAKEINTDVYGWLEVSGIGISAPVVQTANNTFYRNHNWKDESSDDGAYFFDAGCYVRYFEDLSPNAVIYGKKTDVGADGNSDAIKFLQLERYLDKTFMQENSTIRLTINEFETPYEVIAAGYIDLENDSHMLKPNPTIEEFQLVLQAIDRINVHDTEFLNEGIINIITLVAYTEDSTEAFIVVGKFAF